MHINYSKDCTNSAQAVVGLLTITKRVTYIYIYTKTLQQKELHVCVEFDLVILNYGSTKTLQDTKKKKCRSRSNHSWRLTIALSATRCRGNFLKVPSISLVSL